MKPVSIICVYNKTFILKNQLLKSLKIQKSDYELILVDNRNNKFKSATSALNFGAKKATGEYLIFVHQDIIIDNPNWLEETISEIKKLDNPGIVGVAGKTNTRFIRTNILHGTPPKKVTPFPLEKPEIASTVDECLFIIPKKVFDLLQFDEQTCFDWHLYATDYVLSVKKLGFNPYIIPTNLVHTSEGASMSEGYYETMKKLQIKHFNEHTIRNCMTDWYTYIPVSVQRKMKAYNKKSDGVKLNFFDRFMANRTANKQYHRIDFNTRKFIERSGLFDENYYRKKYHINTKKYDPLSHFMTVGYKKYYNPSLKFDTTDYYTRYPDIKHVDLNPLVHYLNFGKKEGRTIKPVTTTKAKIGRKLKNSFNHLKYNSLNKEYHIIDKNTRNFIERSGLFDENYYTKKYHINTKKYDPLSHFMTVGYKKSYNPSLKFDTSYYYARYPDVKTVGLNPLVHYLNYGKKEGRVIKPVTTTKAKIKHNLLNLTNSPNGYLLLKSKFNRTLFSKYKKEYDMIEKSGLFDEEFYKKQANVSNFNNDLILHYMFIGQNLAPNSYLNTNYYIDRYQNNNALLMYLKYEKNLPIKLNKTNIGEHDLIKNSGLFNDDYYIKNYPETNKYKSDLISHFMQIGFKKGYNPSENFDTNWYLDSYPNVKKANMNPVTHYIKYGQYEKKITKPISEESANEIINNIDSIARKEPLREFDENSPLVSIIILTRNGIDYLKTLFKNFKETICYPNYEIIVVDNDSTDDSVKYLKTLTKELPLKIIENKINESFSEANNKAVAESNGEYVLLLNNDMEPIYGWLNHMMNSYLSNENVGIVGAKLIYPYRENNPTSLRTQNEGIKYTELNGFLEKNDGFIVPYNIKENEIYADDTGDQEIASILGASLLIKKDLYDEVGGLDDEYIYNYEDIDLCFKIQEKGYKVIYSPKSKLYHYYQATRDEAFDLSPRDMKNRIYLYKKWNQWLCQQLFMDRLNNKLVFSEKPLNISFISKTNDLLESDRLVIADRLNNYNYTETFKQDHFGIKLKELGWEITPMKYKAGNIAVKKDTDIVIVDEPAFNPKSIIKNNVHQIKIAVITQSINQWKNNKFLNDYDLIIVENRYFNKFKDYLHVYRLNSPSSLFIQIKNILNDLYENDNLIFDEMLKNYPFEETISYGEDYLIIENSEYFDEKWYAEHYDISNDSLDPVSHYLKIGGMKGYDPSENFSSEEYYYYNPDVKKIGMNPLLHYEKYGKDELRRRQRDDEDYEPYAEFLSLTSEQRYPQTKKSFKTKNNQIFFYSPWSDEKNGKLNENSEMVYNKLNKKYDKKIYTNKKMDKKDYLEVLQDLLESKVIVLDQGMGLLSRLKLKEDQKIVNIWHACGAFKTIGYDSPVYNDNQLKEFGIQFSQYTNFIVSSPKISNIYASAHGMEEKDVLGLGVPRTDLFFDEQYKKDELNKFYEKYPSLKDKEIILYAPTFRDTYTLDTKINWDTLSKKLDSNEVFIIKRHIQTTEDILNGEEYDNIFYLEEEDTSLFTLMFASKLMITDYSSVIFEYSLLNKPVIHYCPDFEKYLSIREFYLNFNHELYGDIVKTPEELIEKIENKDYKRNTIRLDIFKKKFMSACDGHATERVVELLEKYMEE